MKSCFLLPSDFSSISDRLSPPPIFPPPFTNNIPFLHFSLPHLPHPIGGRRHGPAPQRPSRPHPGSCAPPLSKGRAPPCWLKSATLLHVPRMPVFRRAKSVHLQPSRAGPFRCRRKCVNFSSPPSYFFFLTPLSLLVSRFLYYVSLPFIFPPPL